MMRRWLPLGLAVPILAGVLGLAWIGHAEQPARSTVGGTIVPSGLHCQEDEVINFVGIDTLACRHIDTFKNPAPASCASSVFQAPNEPPSTPERTGRCISSEGEQK